jgi:hypothetical protein
MELITLFRRERIKQIILSSVPDLNSVASSVPIYLAGWKASSNGHVGLKMADMIRLRKNMSSTMTRKNAQKPFQVPSRCILYCTYCICYDRKNYGLKEEKNFQAVKKNKERLKERKKRTKKERKKERQKERKKNTKERKKERKKDRKKDERKKKERKKDRKKEKRRKERKKERKKEIKKERKKERKKDGERCITCLVDRAGEWREWR